MESISKAASTIANALVLLTNRVKAVVNRVLPPERRENVQQHLINFSTAHPLLATLVLSQVVFSGTPLILFVLLAVGVLVFSLVAALVIGLLGALLFTVFCVGIALLFLLPTLFITTFLATGAWLWVWGAFLVVRWFGAHDTELLTKLSSDLTPQFFGKSDTERDLHSEHVEKQENTSDGPHGTETNSQEQSEPRSEAAHKKAPGIKTINEPIVDVQNQTHGANVTAVSA